MKKLAATISTICFGALGITGPAIAGGPDFACNTSGTACACGDLYEVSLNCDNAGTETGGLDIGCDDGDGTFDLLVMDDGDFLCDMDGFLDLPKTEGKCTTADKGPNKVPGNGKNPHSGTGATQVNFEIKLAEEGAAECSA